ncbi:MAG: hypothetical protein CFH25_00407 [Alphaproteobacteria bacterium MarineAlpha6_Bin3]|nr:MAG: hypothetical protein CFH25_00407 [Alphaproteobacteria bacterium MarineAlpha6_Bin3]
MNSQIFNMKNIFIKILKEIIANLIIFSGIPFLIRNFIARKKVTIILYHNPKEEVLEKHLNYLNKKYNFIKLEDLTYSLYKKTWKNMPNFPLIITFDDGYKNNYKLINLFKKYKVKPTIYLCTKIVNSLKLFWFKVLNDKSKEHLKRVSQSERERILRKKFNFSKDNVVSKSQRQSLSKNEIINMKENVNFESHSRYHPILPKCTEEESLSEIKLSRNDLKKLFKRKFDHFSFPNGDYSQREVNYLKKFGYKTSRTCDIGWNYFDTNPFLLKTCLITDTASISMLKAQISGVTGFLRYFKNFGTINGKKK